MKFNPGDEAFGVLHKNIVGQLVFCQCMGCRAFEIRWDQNLMFVVLFFEEIIVGFLGGFL